MAEWNIRDKNGNWKGGRTITSHGYVLIRVGVNHHLADCRGYAYEHRIEAEKKINRKLKKGELVHHVDGNKQNNSHDNLQVVLGNSEHLFFHRKKDCSRISPGEENNIIDCECGCGEVFLKYDKYGRGRKYISGHNASVRPSFTSELLFYLKNIPEPSTSLFISSFLDVPRKKVSLAFTSLKKQGKVYTKNRSWFLAGDKKQ